MANPQLENGHLRIANEVWEHLTAAGLNGTQLSIVMVVIRKTWGFRKKVAPISLNEFESLTGHGRRNIIRERSRLIQMNVIQQQSRPSFSTAATWAVNKNWEAWEVAKKATGDVNATGDQKGTATGDQKGTATGDEKGTKEVAKKATIKRQVKNIIKDKAEPSSAPDRDRPFIEMPTKDGQPCFVMLSKVEEWEQTFPNLNVRDQIKRARQWCFDNPTKKKTGAGMNKFIFGWLNRQKPEEQQRMSRTEKNIQAVREFADEGAFDRIVEKARAEGGIQ